MKARLRFVLTYFACWIAWFVVGKLIFLAWYWRETSALHFGTILGTLLWGLRMDASSAAYLLTLPMVCIALTSYVPWRFVRPVVVAWTVLFIAIVAGLTVGDLGLFREWGFRIDSTWFMYLNRPKEMLASAGSSPVIPLLLIFAGYGALGVWGFRRWTLPAADAPGWAPSGFFTIPVAALIVGILVFPARGGFQLAPLTHSSVYFSTSDFANQAALNVGWNFFNSIHRHEYDRTNPYRFLPDSEARARAAALLHADAGVPPSLLRLRRPNVILIVWESFTAKLAAVTGGRHGVVPEFDSLARTGILFDRFYASGNRTEKGLPAIFSGYPAIGDISIIKIPRKVASLPGVARNLDSVGYDTRFLYGGELAWANFRSYLQHAGFADVSGDEVFDRGLSKTTWGYQDHVMFDRAGLIVDSLRRPFFFGILTLSSHEPYEIPVAHAFPGGDIQQLFLSAHHYTDQSLGAFVRALAGKPVWDSTVVVILADHGHRLPQLDPPADLSDPSAFHIPMLWIGGALAVRDTVIHTIGSQTDLAPTLLDQLGLPRGQYLWGDDILLPRHLPDAYYAFHDGFGYVTQHGGFAYDDVGHRLLEHWGRVDSADVRNGLALQQVTAGDYEAR